MKSREIKNLKCKGYNQRFAYSLPRVTLPRETKSKMEDLSGSSFVLNSLLSGVIEAVNVSFHSILVLVIAD